MKTVKIVRPFNYTLPDGSWLPIDPGVQELPDEIADNWFVQQHTDNPPKTEPPVGTPEYIHAQAQERVRRRLMDAAVKEEETRMANERRVNRRAFSEQQS